MSRTPKVPVKVLERIADLMNAIGVFEALRVLSDEGLDAAWEREGPLRCGEHFLVVPYTEHLSRKRAKVGPPPEPDQLPTILIPELVLLDVLPDFFRSFCQPYRFALQVHSNVVSHEQKALLESKTEQQMRRYFGQFVSDFLNAWLYCMGAETWRRVATMLTAPAQATLAENPLTSAIASLQQKLRALPKGLLPAPAARLAAMVPALSLRGIDRGRFRWGIEALCHQIWPHHPFDITFPGNAASWARIHPASVTQLGIRCGRLGEDFYLGDEVRQECTTLQVVLKTRSATVFQDLKPGLLRDTLQMIGQSWLVSRRLRLSLDCQFVGQLDDMPWQLGGKAITHANTDVTHPPPEQREEDDLGRLGYTTYLT